MSQTHAVIVAVERYLDPRVAGVGFARADGEALAAALEAGSPVEASLLVDKAATRATVESALQAACDRAGAADTLVFSFCGHGVGLAGGVLLACYDAGAEAVAVASIELAQVIGWMRKSASRRCVLLLDVGHGAMVSDVAVPAADVGTLSALLADSPTVLTLVSCAPSEVSHSSASHGRGVWAWHLTEALRGEAPAALSAGRVLSAGGLQRYLEAEVPRTLRSVRSDQATQAPAIYGAAAEDFVVAELAASAAGPEERTALASLARAIRLQAVEAGRIKNLSGFRTHHKVPKEASERADEFVRSAATADIEGWGEELFSSIRIAFRYTRRDLAVTYVAGGVGIVAPGFTVRLDVGVDDEDPSSYRLTTEVSELSDPDILGSDAFNDVFGHRFDSLVMVFSGRIELEDLIDAIELADAPEVELSYPSDCSQCTLEFGTHAIRIVFDRASMTISTGSEASGSQLLESLLAVQQALLGKSEIVAALESGGAARR